MFESRSAKEAAILGSTVYVVSCGELGEGGTIAAVRNTLQGAKRTADEHIVSRAYRSPKTPRELMRAAKALPWERHSDSAYRKFFGGCDYVEVQRCKVGK